MSFSEKDKNRVLFCEYMLIIVASVIGKKAQDFYLDSPISQFGLDSIAVVNIVSIVNQAFKLKISPVSLYGYKTVEEAARRLYHKFEASINFSEVTPEFIQSLCDKTLNTESECKTEQVILVSPAGNQEGNKEVSSYTQAGLVEVLSMRAQNEPNSPAYTLLNIESNEVGTISNTDLHKKSLCIAKDIQDKSSNAERVLLLFDQTAHFVYALCGTFYSGSIAVPFKAPLQDINDHYVASLLEVIKDCRPRVVFTTRKIFAQLNNLISEAIKRYSIKIIVYDGIDFDQNVDSDIICQNPMALIQYSTGLSSAPKGVLYSHADLVKHVKRIKHCYRLGKDSRLLSWAPAHHYMGLFYGVLLPLYSGLPAYLYTATNVKFRAKMWLNTIAKYRITFSGGPEFAFELCHNLALEEYSEKLDLSSWTTAYIGAQVISRDVVRRFVAKFQGYGFNFEAVWPSYGMAEAPLISATKISSDMAQAEIVSSGAAVDNINIQIMEPLKNTHCTVGELGEICFADAENARVRTGDIGYIQNRMLYVCGKLNDATQVSNLQPVNKEPSKEAIAVVGMAGVFPKSDSCDEFWKNLEAGNDLISEIPENRWDWQEIYGEPDNESQITDIKWGGFINDIEAFDASFFNISSREAQLMDPMQRKLIQIVWHAVEDAGYRMSDLAGKKVAVIVGIGTFDYLQLVLEDTGFTHAYASTGIVHCMASNRISYLYDFKGPSESVDTACSSSLVAMHRAVGLIRNNDCEMAIVCGANVLLSSSVYVALSNAGMLTKSGRCRTFDDKADGYVRGEGVAAIVLKKLAAAKLNHDNIYGLVQGVAVNHGGHTSSLTAPNPISQAEVIESSLQDAGFDSSTISYIETHGTATVLGDPIEISGLTEAFSAANNSATQGTTQHCALGSVKTNIGHLEAAAGISSIIKVLLSMRHKTIPAHIHFSTFNKNIHLEDTPFYLNTHTSAWDLLKNEAGETIPRRAGVSSFGFGGVNSHVTLEEHQDDNVSDISTIKNIFLFSAKTESVLSTYVALYHDFVKDHAAQISLNNMAFTLQVGREAFDYRLAIVASSAEELIEKLQKLSKPSLDLTNHDVNHAYYSKVQHRPSNQSLNACDADLEKIAQSWTLGENIEWMPLYIGQSVRRISLPTYPFEKKQHWVTRANKNDKKHTLINDTYDVNWHAEPLLGDFKDGQAEYIVFCDRQGVSNELINQLRNNNIKVHSIYYDAGEENAIDTYSVNPVINDSYVDVFYKIINKSENKTFKVLNCWPLDFSANSETSLEDLSEGYNFVCQTALNQVQALNSLGGDIDANLWIVCANVQAVLNPNINLVSAPLWGMARTLVLEQPSLFRSIIDIDLNANFDVKALLDEIKSFSNESEVVYRQGARYVSRMEPCAVERGEGNKIISDGAYLITGGLGSLGLLLALWLSSLNVSKVYLLSRRAPEDNKNYPNIRATIERIRLNGTMVEVLQADVTNINQMKSIAELHFDTDELKGVFHLAGSYQESLLKDMSFDDFKQVVSAKVEGTWVLHDIFKHHNLSCFVMFSSGASIWGAATGGHYSAGNYFLDAYAEYCESNNMPAMSISWGGLWKSTGLIPKDKEAYFKSIGVKETSQEEGFQQLASIVDSACYKKIIAPIEWPLFLEVMSAQRKKSLFNKLVLKGNNNINTPPENALFDAIATLPSREERYQSIIAELKSLIISILSIEDGLEFNEDVGFFNLGLDSLASIDFKNKINKTLGVSISTTTLFDCNTLRLLGEYLLTEYFNDVTDEEENKESDLNNLDKRELLKFLELELQL